MYPVEAKMKYLKDLIKLMLMEHLACLKLIRANANASSSDSVSSDEHLDNSSVSGDNSSSSSDDYDSSDDNGSSSDHQGNGTSSESEADSNEAIFTDLKANPPDWTTNFTPIDVPGFRLQSGPDLPDGWDIHSPPLKYFQLFFTSDLIEQFVKYTNEYAQIAIRKKRQTVPSYCNLAGYSLFGRVLIGVKIKVHNVFYTHTSIYSKLILTMVSNMFYNFLDFLTQ